jgi:hypothetical protein
MRRLLVATLIGFTVADPGARVMAAEACPVDDQAVEKAGGYVNAVETAVEAASTCERSYQIFAACQLGSSGDNALAEIVQGKCEPLFIGKVSPAAKAVTRRRRFAGIRLPRKTKGQCTRVSRRCVEPKQHGILLANILVEDSNLERLLGQLRLFTEPMHVATPSW